MENKSRRKRVNPSARASWWVRLYIEALNDPKIIKLSDFEFRKWVQTLLVAGMHQDGILPVADDMAVHWRCSSEDAERTYLRLIQLKLIECVTGDVTGERGYAPNNWARRQYAGASSTERSRKCRAKNVGKLCNANATQMQRDGSVRSESVSESEYSTEGKSTLPQSQRLPVKNGGSVGVRTVRGRAR